MEKKRLRHYVVVFALMAVVAVALSLQRELRVLPETDLNVNLPPRVGEYVGHDRFFCQNELCLKSFLEMELQATNACPACSNRLDRISLGERQLLPADTVIGRKEYVSSSGNEMTVSIVLSGKEQKSIHRPQQCLPAQGYVIDANRVITVPLEGRDPLRVMVLDVRRPMKTPDGRSVDYRSNYAYWFVGKGRETPYHWQRLFWMSSDMLLRNVAHRWAYVAVSTQRQRNSDEHVQRLKDFIARLYPLIVEPEAGGMEETSKIPVK